MALRVGGRWLGVNLVVSAVLAICMAGAGRPEPDVHVRLKRRKKKERRPKGGNEGIVG